MDWTVPPLSSSVLCAVTWWLSVLPLDEVAQIASLNLSRSDVDVPTIRIRPDATADVNKDASSNVSGVRFRVGCLLLLVNRDVFALQIDSD
jgi:hypothetical protein